MAFRRPFSLHKIPPVSGYTVARGISGILSVRCQFVALTGSSSKVVDSGLVPLFRFSHLQTKTNVQPTCFQAKS